MTRRPTGPSGQPEPEGHQWVAMFLFEPDDGGFAWEDVQLLSYVPRTAQPGVAFDGLVEQERQELQREDESLAVVRIRLALYDEDTAKALAIKDAVNQSPDAEWTFEQTFDGGDGVAFDAAVTQFRSAVSQQAGPSVDAGGK